MQYNIKIHFAATTLIHIAIPRWIGANTTNEEMAEARNDSISTFRSNTSVCFHYTEEQAWL